MVATSGTATFNYNRDQIIRAAARKCNAISSGDVMSAAMLQDFADQLNIMVKAWNASGLHIWTETEATLFLQSGQFSYILGGATADHATLAYTGSTTILTGALPGATSIAVKSIIGFSNSDNIAVTLDDGTLQWTTVNGVPSGSTINLAAALTDSASVGNPVYDYPAANAVVRPLRIVSARRYNFLSAIETPMDPPMSRLDYRALPNKTNPGTPTRFFYDPRGGANNQGIVYVWPAPADSANAMNFTWWRPIQDFNVPGNIPDLPTEWLDALVWNLAKKMTPEYPVNAQLYQIIAGEAAESLDLVTGYDREPESYLFGFNADQTGP
jgi:hypothetical protein